MTAMTATNLPVIMVDGNPVPTTPFEHPHGRPEDLFLLADPPNPVPPGTKITWAGKMPEGKANLWVRIPCAVGGLGTFRLRDLGTFRLREMDYEEKP